MNNKPLIHRHTETFRYGKKEIPFHFWSHISKEDTTIDTIIFLGTSQSGRIARWVAQNAPTGTAIIEGLPHRHADQSARDLREFAASYTTNALFAALSTFKISSVNIVAESQAAPGAIWASLSHHAQVKNVALIAPLGLTAHVFGNSPQERLKELKKRAFLSAIQFAQSPLYDTHNFYLNALMIHAILYDGRWNVSGQKYAAGASHDLRAECRMLAEQLHKRGGHLTLILGEHDKIFPPNEVMNSIKEAGIAPVETIILKTSHASLAIHDGRQILGRAVLAARQPFGHDPENSTAKSLV